MRLADCKALMLIRGRPLTTRRQRGRVRLERPLRIIKRGCRVIAKFRIEVNRHVQAAAVVGMVAG